MSILQKPAVEESEPSEAAGSHFLNEAEMEAHLQWLRDDEDRQLRQTLMDA